MQALVSFGSTAMTVSSVNPKSGAESVRVMNVGEFKRKNGLKGNEATRQYNVYLRSQGTADAGELNKQLTIGALIPTGYTNYKKSVTVRFLKTAMIKDPVVKAVEAKPVVIADVFGALSDADKAAFIAQFIGKAA